MNTSRRTAIRRALGTVVAAVLALGGVLAVGAPASAATDFTYPNAISNIQVQRESGSSGPLQQWDLVKITADWSVPDGAQPGETFGMTLPVEFARYGSGTFNLADPVTGAVLATCQVSQGDGPEVGCTLTDAVVGLEDVGGSMWLTVQATGTTNEDGLYFQVGDDYVYAELPGGGGIEPGDPTAPKNPYKYGSPTSVDGQIQWTIVVPPAFVRDGAFTVSDTLDPTHEAHHYTGYFRVYYQEVDEGQLVGDWHTVDGSNYSVTYGAGNTSFDFEAHNLPDANYMYILIYRTEVDDIALEGDIFGNNATIESYTTSTTFTYESAGGGDGTGHMYTRFTITKALAGDQADAATGAVFTVRYALKGSAEPAKTLQLTVGQPARSDRAPIGSTFVIEEIDFPQLTGVTWNDWTLTGAGVTDNGDGTWDVTPETSAGVELTLTNQADPTPGRVTWSKTDPAGELLDGSEWELHGPDGTTIVVVDNGARDVDPDAGELDVTDLAWGEYALVETKAPAGYQRSDAVHTVVVDGEHLEVSFGDIVNLPTPPVEKTPPPAEKTGPATMASTGFDAAGWVVLGAAFLAGGVVIAIVEGRRKAAAANARKHDD